MLSGHTGRGQQAYVESKVAQATAMREASLSARLCLRLPQAWASVCQPATWVKLDGHATWLSQRVVGFALLSTPRLALPHVLALRQLTLALTLTLTLTRLQPHVLKLRQLRTLTLHLKPKG